MSARPQLRYTAVRDGIATGDVLLFSGRGPISRFIRWGSESRYSHCGIASWERGQLCVFHAVIQGVHHERASVAVGKYSGRVDWFSLRPEVSDEVDRSGIVKEARRHLGKPFDVTGVTSLMWRVLRGCYRGTSDGRGPVPAMFCSWYVSHCYRVGGGLDLVDDAADHCTSPGMLERSDHLVLQGTLHHGI